MHCRAAVVQWQFGAAVDHAKSPSKHRARGPFHSAVVATDSRCTDSKHMSTEL